MSNIQVALKVTEEEAVQMEAFAQSPMFKTMCHLLDGAVAQWHQQMDMTRDVHEIFNMQGRVNAARWMQNIPLILKRQAEAKRAAEEARPKKRSSPNE